MRLFEELHIVTKKEVCEANICKHSTTYSLMRSLSNKGYLKSVRGNQFYSLSFITLTSLELAYLAHLKQFVRLYISD
jgi:DNA-binding IclR family transcriptional regulator